MIPGDRLPPAETSLVVGIASGSHFVHHMYLVLLPPILGILTGEFGVSLAALGLAMGVGGLVNTIFQLPYGYVSDNHSRTVALAASLGFGAAGALATALAPTYAWLLAGQALLGLGVAGHHAAHYPLIADATPEDLRGRAFSVHGLAGSLGFAAPPAFITAVIGAGLTWRHALAAIAVAGAAFGVVAVPLLRLRAGPGVRLPETDGARGSARDRLAGEFRALAASPAILALAVLALVTSTAAWGVTSFSVVILTDGYGVALSTANLALTGTFVVGAAMILLGGVLSDRVAAGPVLAGSYAALAMVVAVLGSLSVPAAVAVAAVVAVSVRTVGLPARSKLTDALSSRSDLGKNFAAITVGIMAGNALAPPLFGFVIDSLGHRTAFGLIAGFALGGAALTVGIIRRFGDGNGG